jgi:hypothetical protein
MSYTAIVYRVFLASPSNLKDEREIIPEIIYKWNAANSARTNIVLLPVLWETSAIPEIGRDPQLIINEKLVTHCDLLIGAFWTRIGRATKRYDSATIEEIEEAIKAKIPVLLYFSTKEVHLTKPELEEYEKMLELIEHYRSIGIAFDYKSIDELKEHLYNHLPQYIDELRKRDSESLKNLSIEQKTIIVPSHEQNNGNNSSIQGFVTNYAGYMTDHAIITLYKCELKDGRYIPAEKVNISNNAQRSNGGAYKFTGVKPGYYMITAKNYDHYCESFIKHEIGDTILDITIDGIINE